MIKNQIFLILFLLGIEIIVLYLSSHTRFKRYFSFLPSIFWIYFLPMLCSTAGLIDPKSALYSKITTYLLPASLILLLMVVDIKAILRLGPKALFMFFIGSFGIMLGAAVTFYLFKDLVGVEFASGFGALSASWTGGSANMIAVKEAAGTPDNVFLPMVIVDTIVPYVWMGILVALAGFQLTFDRLIQARRETLDDLSQTIAKKDSKNPRPLKVGPVILILVIALAGSYLAQGAAQYFPVIKDIISTYAWTIIIVSFLGIGLSFTKVRNLEEFGSTRIGYFILYFVLASIGAKASLANIGSTFILILAGFLIVFIHALVLLAAAKLIKVPMFLAATASQANIGGVASAPIVAEVYQKGLAPAGLLLAILGNIVGTYLGIITTQLCRWVVRF